MRLLPRPRKLHAMLRHRRSHRRPLPALLSVLLAFLAAAPALLLTVLVARASAAEPEKYGELAHFGSAGVGHGQFKITTGTHAFGVDTSDDSVYVGDEPKRREYRIQKLTDTGTFVAQTAFFKPPEHDGIEGIAVDPAEKRIYVLALETRGASDVIDPGAPAAGTLYAFSTEPSGEVLEPATGTTEGVLAGPAELASQSDLAEGALLEPKGIAVDPTTHDIVIMGEVALQVPKEGEELQLRVALQRVHANGTLGARYVDTGGVLTAASEPSSPAITSTGAVYVALSQALLREDPLTKTTEAVDDLMRIPSDFTSAAPPTPAVEMLLRGPVGEQGRPVIELESGEPTRDGGGLSFAPEGLGGGGQGALYARAHAFVVSQEEEGFYYPGALAFDVASGTEIGWTGGQTKKSGTENCTISFGGETYATVAAGSGELLFLLDPGRPAPFRAPHVVKFGPGGSGCPTAEATSPIAELGGQPLLSGETVSPGTPITFTSTLTQANALSVEWNFGDGQTATESADEYQHIGIKHAFVRGGELTVTETIHTDDLQTPTIVKQTKISVSNIAVPPTAVLEGPTELVLGSAGPQRLVYLENGGLGLEGGTATPGAVSAVFDGSASYDPNPPGSNGIESYHWDFGDGGATTTEGPTVAHSYDKPGSYKVELTVTDAAGLTSAPSALTVIVAEPRPIAQAAAHPLVVSPAIATSSPSPSPPAPVKASVKPAARLASTSLIASATGTVKLVVTCPSGATACVGDVTLSTLGAVATRVQSRGARARTRLNVTVTIATGRFAIAGGRQKALTLRLTSRARGLLARERRLRARATIVAHDTAGAIDTARSVVSLRSARM